MGLSCLAGIDNEFLFTGRLDNLGMSYCSLAALLDSYPTEAHLADESAVKAIALFDHEEVGSASAQGKQHPLTPKYCPACIAHVLCYRGVSSTMHSVGIVVSVKMCVLIVLTTSVSRD